MKNIAVIGFQWGDEGKGGVISSLAPGYDVIARYQGGPNAGHTSYHGGQRFVLHSLPSGVLHPHIINVMGNGMVINPDLIVNSEIAGLEASGIDLRGRLLISDHAPVILPHHIALEYIRSTSKKIDTTKQGIGPCYAAHRDRMCLEVGDYYGSAESVADAIKRYDDELRISERFEGVKDEVMQASNGRLPEALATLDAERVAEKYMKLFEKLERRVTDTAYLMNRYVKEKNILFEGSQGTLLDIDHGTYPFVTSSTTVSAGIGSGLGIDPRAVGEVLGVMKAVYLTRVGSGPCVTELGDPSLLKGEQRLNTKFPEFLELENRVIEGLANDYELGRYFRAKGGEYGATTGRPRRTAHQDLVALSYALMFGVDSLALTKLDVGDFVPEHKFCVAYRNKNTGEVTDRFDSRRLYDYEPVYESIPGWMTSTFGETSYDKLPENAKAVVERFKDYKPIKMVHTGPEERHVIWM